VANSAMDRRYSMMRQQIQDQENEQRQQEIEGMRRRFASMGALGSGAALKSEQKTQQAGVKRLQSAFGQLDIARLGEEQQMEEAEKQRGFMRGEREASQLYGSGEAEKQRGFMTNERLGGQQFLSGENALQRSFMTGERVAGQEFLSGENKTQREFATSEREAAQTYGTSEREASETFQSGVIDKQFAQQLSLLMKQLASQEGQAVALRVLQKEMFSKEFDLNKEIAYFNMYGKGGKPKTNPLSQMGSVTTSDISRGMQNINFSGIGGGYPTLNYSNMG